MLQGVATFVSSVIALGGIALIAGFLMRDWRMIVRALRNDRQFLSLPLPVQARVTLHDRRVRVISVRSQSVPQRAFA